MLEFTMLNDYLLLSPKYSHVDNLLYNNLQKA